MPQEKVMLPGGGARYIPTCKICDNPGRARLIEADWAAKRSAVAIAKDMTANGWPITDATVLKHLKHVPGAHNRTNEPLPSLGPKRATDGVEFVKGKLLDAIIAKERRLRKAAEIEGEDFDGEFMLDKDLQPALNTILKSEGIKIKREEAASKRQIGLFMLMLGKSGGLAPAGLIGDGAIEGEFKDVTPEDEDEDGAAAE